MVGRVRELAVWIAVVALGGCGLVSGDDTRQAFFDVDDRVVGVEAGEWGATQNDVAVGDTLYIVVVAWRSPTFDEQDLRRLLTAYHQVLPVDYEHKMVLGVDEEGGDGDRPDNINSTASFDLKQRGDALGLPGATYGGDWNDSLSFDRETLSKWVDGWS